MLIFIAVMKYHLIILIIFCCLFNTVCGQSSSAAIDSLVKFKVIKAKDRPIMEKEVRDDSLASSYRVAVLAELHYLMLQKTFHINQRKTNAAYFFKYDAGSLDKKRRDSMITSLRGLLEKINKAGLLTDRVYASSQKDVDSGLYVADVQLVGHLMEMSARLDWLTPDKLLPVAEQLHAGGIVSDSSFVQLQNDINSGKIESSFQLIEYCKLARTFDLTKYPEDDSLSLKRIHRDIASILPGLNFTNFSYTTKPITLSLVGSVPATRFTMSLTCNGRVYKSKSEGMNFLIKEGKVRVFDLFPQGFHQIFNKVLIDQHSPFRLYAIEFSRRSSTENHLDHLAVIALREEQTKVFRKDPCSSYMSVGSGNYDNTLTSGRIDSAIAGWKKMGLFAHLSESEIENAINDAESDNRYSMNSLLLNFPGVIYPSDSLMRMIMTQRRPYSNILKHLADITHGVFNPTKITQKKTNGVIKIQYSSKGKTHSYMVNTANGWQDDKFPGFLKSLGPENNLPGSFYWLPYSGVIYLTNEQYDYALKNKLLEFDRPIPKKAEKTH
jgi:hypothetical protein